MENAATIETLFEKAGDYGKTTAELLKLNALSKCADVVSSLVTRLATLVVVALFIITINIGIALWLGELLGRSYYGFFVVAGCYCIIAILLNVFRRQWVETPIRNAIVSEVLHKEMV
jgi:hypothetical protein